MTARLRQLLACLLVLLAAGSGSAQLDPRWRTRTDLTDLLRQPPGKAELLCLLDFSASSSAVVWHPYYQAGPDPWKHFRPPVRTRDYPRSADPDQDCVYFHYTLAYAPAGRTYAMELQVCWNDSDRDYSGAYPFYGMRGPLVAGDGTVIDQAYLLARGETLPSRPGARDGSLGDPATWVKYASHARIATDGRSGFPFSGYCGADVPAPGRNGTLGRTIDLPVPWRLLESPPEVPAETCDDPAVTAFVYANRSPLTVRTGGGDDRWAGREVALDSTGWLDHRPGGIPRPAVGAVAHVDAGHPRSAGVLAVEGGRPILYQTDYLFWIFFGTAGVPSRKNPAGEGAGTATGGLAAFVVPQVTEPNAKGILATAWQNGLPARCRYQAAKAALLTAHFGVLAGGGRVRDASRWAFRCLDRADREDCGLALDRSPHWLADPAELAWLQGLAPGQAQASAAQAWAQIRAGAPDGPGAAFFDRPAGGGSADGCGTRHLLLIPAGGSGWERQAPPGAAGEAPAAEPDPERSGACLPAHCEADLVRGLERLAERVSQPAPAAAADSLVALTLGNCAYLGVVRPGRSTRWSGDLLMIGLEPSGARAAPLDGEGRPLGVPAAAGAIWAASRILGGYGTADRRQGRVYTLLPGAAALSLVAPGDGAWLKVLKQAIAEASGARPTDAGLIRSLWSMLGADIRMAETAGPGTGTYPMRRDGGMGDIISSTPALLAYPAAWAERVPELRQALEEARRAGCRPRFRVLFVGTNQGHLHAFGEVSWDPPAGPAGGVALPRARAVELWSFIPTEAILQPWYLDDLDPAGRPNAVPNPHPYLVDGAPRVYFNARPGRRSGDGSAVQSRDTALLLFGLGKGGRSFYCLDVRDPLRPAQHWALRPDEVSAAGNPVIRSMGLSTSRPAVARALNAEGRVADFLVLGGGFSTDEIERRPGWGPGDPPRPFGRSLVLFDLIQGPGDYRTGPGRVLGHTDPELGSVAAGVAPLEVFPGCGMTQRVYGADRRGGVWALGAADRRDSSRVADWQLRPVLRSGSVISTVPEVFTLPGGRIPGTASRAAGVVVGTGDRNDPLDRAAPGPGAAPNRLMLVFDAPDPARDGGARDPERLADLTWAAGAELDPAAYLQWDPRIRQPGRWGFRLDLPRAERPYRAKVLQDPLVSHGVLFFSVFLPRKDPRRPCAQGGVTETFRFGRAWSPLFAGGTRIAQGLADGGEGASGRLAGAAAVGLAGALALQPDGQVAWIGRDRAAAPGPDPIQGLELRRVPGRARPSRLRVRAWRSLPSSP